MLFPGWASLSTLTTGVVTATTVPSTIPFGIHCFLLEKLTRGTLIVSDEQDSAGINNLPKDNPLSNITLAEGSSNRLLDAQLVEMSTATDIIE